MKTRGLYFCANDETCNLAPEIWRDLGGKMKIGLCRKHAIAQGWCEALAPATKIEKKKSLLQKLLDELEATKQNPPAEKAKPRYWWDEHPNQDPF